jgi:hypothetical protein
MAEMAVSIHGFVTKKEVKDVLETHPNDLAGPWWDNPVETLPPLRPFQLPRNPIPLSITNIPVPSHRVSVKKQHEVSRMTQFIADLLPARFPSLRLSGVHIVDVGAGHAYVTRALHTLFNAPTLALDSNHAIGHPEDGITRKTVHITPQSLLNAIDDWIPSSSTPVPVLLVALHACGSLTPDILRAFLSVHKNPHNHPTWSPVAAVVVGCCYNLMSLPTDFPLSSALLSAAPPLNLPRSAFQLASQVPSSSASASLSTRKVVWRALLARLMPDPANGAPIRRLGKLNNAVYANWPTFLNVASERLGWDFNTANRARAAVNDPDTEYDSFLARRLELLHNLRCKLGPVIESLIILDRVDWVKEVLSQIQYNRLQVELVNLFDQAAGSGRNIAIVIAPPQPD